MSKAHVTAEEPTRQSVVASKLAFVAVATALCVVDVAGVVVAAVGVAVAVRGRAIDLFVRILSNPLLGRCRCRLRKRRPRCSRYERKWNRPSTRRPLFALCRCTYSARSSGAADGCPCALTKR